MKLELDRISADEMESISEKIVGARALIEQAEFLCDKGIVYLGRQDGEPFLLMGIFPIWAGVGQAWVLYREGLAEVPVFTLRSFRKIINLAFDKMGLHRLQIDFDVTNHRGLGMSEAAGFKREGLMRCFDSDKHDHQRMAIIKETPCQ